ncbi:M20/M25/M40 family metallo-hydrolase [Leptospira dzoumogneensis]|uniref:M20/M25/M40 family metallo-hydrolase n=1 Tax=Leptospira dzoumogneensis TaxID=2484904 RepID=A0A4Z1AGX2_9LEPT|nr:M20/M25/M40 family metallo-hydrolase [Leptospira dzoumogneensis]TGN03408.1 M20/M25/M40 family metallo-hydrolase [Leptospira dzoumogneensis]
MNFSRSIFLGAILFLFQCVISPIKNTPMKEENRILSWDKREAEAVKILTDLIRIKSVRGNEKQAAEYIRSIFEKEGIKTKFISEPGHPDRVNLIAELEPNIPTSEKGLILGNHLDVVEADPKEWTEDPFAGVIKEGRIHGRGALDCKGLIAMQIVSFLELKRSTIPLKRKIMFLSMADEESGSERGARFLLKAHPELFKGYGYMLNEGSFGTKDVAIPGSIIFNIQYAEKGNLWLNVRAKGEQGHGSTPSQNYPGLRLLRFLTEVLEYDTDIRISEETQGFFYQLGSISSFPKSFILKNSNIPVLRRLLYGPIRASRQLSAITRNTKAVSGLKTEEGKGHNVLSSLAEAKLDVRLLPGFDPLEYLKEIQKVAEKYEVEVEPAATVPTDISTLDSILFQKLASVATRKIPGSVATPFISPGKTDNAYFRQIGMECYGLIPVLLNEKELTMLHGKNESISIENLKLGTQILFEILYQMN